MNDFEAAAQSGKLWDRYCIYRDNAKLLGEYVKTFDEWLNS